MDTGKLGSKSVYVEPPKQQRKHSFGSLVFQLLLQSSQRSGSQEGNPGRELNSRSSDKVQNKSVTSICKNISGNYNIQDSTSVISKNCKALEMAY